MVAVDRSIDDGAKLRGVAREADYQADELYSAVNWANPQSVLDGRRAAERLGLRPAAGGSGNPLSAAAISSLSFSGPTHHTPPPMEWTSDSRPVTRSCPPGPRRTSTARSSVDHRAGERRPLARVRHEVQHRARLGLRDRPDLDRRRAPLDEHRQRDDDDPAQRRGDRSIVSQLPGFSGVADWSTQTFDLSAYAGQTVLLRFRMMTDTFQLGNNPDESGAGWWIDDVRVGGTLVSDGTLAGWATPRPPIEGYTVQLVAFNGSVPDDPLASAAHERAHRHSLGRAAPSADRRRGRLRRRDRHVRRVDAVDQHLRAVPAARERSVQPGG